MRELKIIVFLAVFIIAGTALAACENTYKGAGRDMDNMSDEMKDGWN